MFNAGRLPPCARWKDRRHCGFRVGQAQHCTPLHEQLSTSEKRMNSRAISKLQAREACPAVQQNAGNAPKPLATGTCGAQHHLARLLDLMAALRDPDKGCGWDRAQNFDSIAPYTIEEAYEVADAIARRDMAALPDELGDLLFQVVYHSQMAEEAGAFSFADVASAITDKMIRRHPQLFPPAETVGAPAVLGWEEHKATERQARAERHTLAGIPAGLPALTHALKLTARAGRVGFDWPDAPAVLDKLFEESEELRAELPGADTARLADEVGDMLFVVANLARKLGLDPEACLQQANRKFAGRFNAVEQRLAAEGMTPADATLDQMEAIWTIVKQKPLENC